MIGAIVGDVVGSRFEWKNCRSKSFDLFASECFMTDDSLMTLAVAQALLDCGGDYAELSAAAVRRMQQFGREYPLRGYGRRFHIWLEADDPKPYGSCGNGAGMRVSPVAYAASSLEQALELSDAVTRVSHDHPDGIAGARAVASSVWLALHGASKAEIRSNITENYYPIDFTLDEIRETYGFGSRCDNSVPQAMEAFLEGKDFEDALRCAVSVGGDTDTVACMTCAVAGAFWGVPLLIRAQTLLRMDAFTQKVLADFEAAFPPKGAI